jgi:hypothetical protein
MAAKAAQLRVAARGIPSSRVGSGSTVNPSGEENHGSDA